MLGRKTRSKSKMPQIAGVAIRRTESAALSAASIEECWRSKGAKAALSAPVVLGVCTYRSGLLSEQNPDAWPP